jgi:alpha-mannosidase
VVVFNALSWQRDDLIWLDLTDDIKGKTIKLTDGSPALSQEVDTPDGLYLLSEVDGVPSLGFRSYELIPASPCENTLHISVNEISTPYYHIKFNQAGQIISLFDRQLKREVLASGGCGNVLQVFQDKPMAFDAWDIDIYYQETQREIKDCVEAVVEANGPLRGTLRFTWKYGDSTIVQRMHVYANNPRIDFETDVDWFESQVLLKTAFPVDIRSTRATYEIQYGQVERPTHWNTSWDWAKFEVSAHQWADLSEGNYGVALLNDCKYGYDIKDNVMRLTLIKSAIRPDALADKGHHRFTYSLLPHAEDWRGGDVTRQARMLNLPLLSKTTTSLPAGHKSFELVVVDVDHVLVDTVKKAEDGLGWIFRVYEYQQKRNKKVNLNFGKTVKKAVECDLMEENHQPVVFSAHQLSFDISPYEIKTFMVWF